MLKGWVLAGLLVTTVAACSGGSPSEQIVRRNLPAEQQAQVAAGDAARASAPRGIVEGGIIERGIIERGVVERASMNDRSITSQEVERELNRLEAELR